jgi:hypothetical protein
MEAEAMNAVALAAEIGKDLARWVAFLYKLSTGNFYGTVTLKFEDGRVVWAKTEQTFKVEELDDFRKRT